MAFTLKAGWCIASFDRNLSRNGAYSMTVVATGDAGVAAVDDVIIVPSHAVVSGEDATLGINRGEAMIKLSDIIGIVT